MVQGFRVFGFRVAISGVFHDKKQKQEVPERGTQETRNFSRARDR